MKKRFTDCEIWGDRWFRELPGEYKNFWRYICDECDPAGVYKLDAGAASFYIGGKIDAEKAAVLFNAGKHRVAILDAERWLVTGFISFQYGALSKDCNAHKSAFASLARNGLKLTKDCAHVDLGAIIPPEPAQKPQDGPPAAAQDTGRATEPAGKPATARKVGFSLPAWLPPAPWGHYVEMRAKMRKPMTDRAKELAIKSLDALRLAGEDPVAVLEQSVMKSWLGLFPVHGDRQQGGGAAVKPGKYAEAAKGGGDVQRRSETK